MTNTKYLNKTKEKKKSLAEGICRICRKTMDNAAYGALINAESWEKYPVLTNRYRGRGRPRKTDYGEPKPLCCEKH